MTEVLIIQNHEGKLRRFDVSVDDTLADLRDLIAEEVDPDFIIPGENFNFYYHDEEDDEDGLVQIFRRHETRHKAVDLKKKNLTLLGAKRRKLGPVASPVAAQVNAPPTSPTTSNVRDQIDADDERKPAAVTPPPRQQAGGLTTTADGGDDNEADAEVKVKDEFEERKKQRKEFYKQYGDKLLLHRHDPMSIPRLGGGVQDSHVHPRKNHPNIFDAKGRFKSSYPVPKFVNVEEFDGAEKESMLPFTYTCYSSLWQPNGPHYAGQPTAALNGVPKYFKETGHPFPVFMKRSLTKRDANSEGPTLGWEYVGNYKVAKTVDAMEEHDKFWESAANFSKASKREIARKHYESSGYGRERLDHWRSRLTDELEKDPSPAAPQYLIERRCPSEMEIKDKRPSLAARARALGFQTDMADLELSQLLVELDEFHGQVLITFVEYDERIYEYCKEVQSKKRKNAKGKPLGAGEKPAKAMDWYNFAEMHGLITY